MKKRCQSLPTVIVVPARGKDNRKTLSERTCLLRGNKTTTADSTLHRKLIFKRIILLISVLQGQPVCRRKGQEAQPGQAVPDLQSSSLPFSCLLAQCVCVTCAFNLSFDLGFRSLCLLPSLCEHRHPARIK